MKKIKLNVKIFVKKRGWSIWTNLFLIKQPINQTQPVGFGRPAILQAPFAGPVGNKS
jgi:hypothetical protein